MTALTWRADHSGNPERTLYRGDRFVGYVVKRYPAGPWFARHYADSGSSELIGDHYATADLARAALIEAAGKEGEGK